MRYVVGLFTLLMVCCPAAFARPEDSAPGGSPAPTQDQTAAPRPPGLAEKGSLPHGLEKQGKTPRGWSQGKARWKHPTQTASGASVGSHGHANHSQGHANHGHGHGHR